MCVRLGPKGGHPKLCLNHCSAGELVVSMSLNGVVKVKVRKLGPGTNFGVGYLQRSLSHWARGKCVRACWMGCQVGLMRSVSISEFQEERPLSGGIFTAIRNRVCPSSSGKVQKQ